MLLQHLDPSAEKDRFFGLCIDLLKIDETIENRRDVVEAFGGELHPDTIGSFMAVLDK
jgi:hypothetical protein